ncbi:MAG: hypothetical protein E6767_06345 [Dysgonomonas sp.]|nr:hypothetical protein [Dysgonomonas sp.]
MAKYSQELVERIVSLLEEDTYSVSEICKLLKIARKSFYEWKDSKPEFKEAVENAQAHCNEKMEALARRSLRRKLEGYTMTEVRTVYVADEEDPSGWKVKARIVKEKEYAPDDKSIRFVLRDRSSKEEEIKNCQPTLNITVTNKEASEMLTQLSQTLRKDAPSLPPPNGEEWREAENDCRGSEGVEVLQNKDEETPVTEKNEDDKTVPIEKGPKVKVKKKILVRDHCLPPGYLYRVEEVEEEE